ncbi:hypothetical protein CEXT_815651 [Caerostris extrusa]|uniref:Uncharacterized protein n=1 Tax=Caerostris extrusa TaxID=172846 RepID=A0AAV4S2A8_CAEEX|nr:hypothetical protein CEXT_815651 [Caerostris extrusa]
MSVTHVWWHPPKSRKLPVVYAEEVVFTVDTLLQVESGECHLNGTHSLAVSKHPVRAVRVVAVVARIIWAPEKNSFWSLNKSFSECGTDPLKIKLFKGGFTY